MKTFPRTRFRRQRSSECMRIISRENTLSAENLILPLFVHEEEKSFVLDQELPDIIRLSQNDLLSTVEKAILLGIKEILLFPVVKEHLKSTDAREAINSSSLICKTIEKIKQNFGNAIIIAADVALDPYTVDGHDGITKNGITQNDITVDILCKQAATLSSAGADVVAPSDMMDGRVGIIRDFLDSCGFQGISIMSYAVKYCSSSYEVFRRAVGSKREKKISKSDYQMDVSNSAEAVEEIIADFSEGADTVIIKPSMMFGDIIKLASEVTGRGIVAYQVSGEYAMIRAAANKGWIDYYSAMYEAMISLKRSGANSIITYAALDILENTDKFCIYSKLHYTHGI